MVGNFRQKQFGQMILHHVLSDTNYVQALFSLSKCLPTTTFLRIYDTKMTFKDLIVLVVGL